LFRIASVLRLETIENHLRQVSARVEDASINLVARWQAGDQQAANELFRRYAGRLIALARSRLSASLSRRVDAEDVVQSAYRSFFAGARDGLYDPQRGGTLWKFLVAITLHKLQDQLERHTAQKRSIKAERCFGTEDTLLGLRAEALARDPSPVEAVALVDQVEQVMRQLDPLQRQIFELRLQGHSLEEIAAQTQRCERTVRRTLERVKERLEQWHAEQTD
jgi:RNA polymerase sigma-70 factor (ECF subfamily)